MRSSYDKNKFVFKELTMNANGKQSGSGFIGVILGMIAAASFIATMFGYFLGIPNTTEVMSMVIQMVFAVSVLLGVRKAASSFRGNHYNENVNENGLNENESQFYDGPVTNTPPDKNTYTQEP